MADVKTVQAYCNVMDEIVWREDVVIRCLNPPPIFRARVMYELCFLQFRMICELIGVGCLIAHGDIKDLGSRRIRKAYTPKDIMAELEKLDLDYYPKPGYLAFKKSKHGLIELIDLNDAFLTKEELLYLYGISGDILHRSLNKIDWPRKGHSNDVHNWLNKIVGLLDHHRIILASGDEELWVEMNNLQNKRPTGWIMQRFALPEKK